MSLDVLIADDQQMVRAGFRMILEAEPDVRVVAEAGDGEEVQSVRPSRRARETAQSVGAAQQSRRQGTMRSARKRPSSRANISSSFPVNSAATPSIADASAGTRWRVA